MDVLRHAAVRWAGEIVVDNMHDVLDVQAARRDTSGNENGAFGSAESASSAMVSSAYSARCTHKFKRPGPEEGKDLQRVFSLPLGTVGVD